MLIHGVIASSRLAMSGAFESIATATGTGSSTTITFSSIPSTYKHLQIRGISKDTYTTSATGDYYTIRFNSDTGTNYAAHSLIGNGSTALTRAETSATYIYIANGSMTSGTGLTNIVGTSIVDVHDYASTTKNKTIRALAGGDANLASTNYRVALSSGLWISTSAITSITITCGSTAFATSSTFALYGIKG